MNTVAMGDVTWNRSQGLTTNEHIKVTPLDSVTMVRSFVGYSTYIYKEPCMTSNHTKSVWLMELLYEHANGNMFRNLLNMVLKGSRSFEDAQMLAMFLRILGH